MYFALLFQKALLTVFLTLFVVPFIMAESDVFDEEKLFATFLQRGKAFGLQETELMDYVDKQIRQAQERQDRLIVRREEEANRKQLELELAAIKERGKRQLDRKNKKRLKDKYKKPRKRKRQNDRLRLIVRLVLKMEARGWVKPLGLVIDQHCPSCPHSETRQTTSTHTFSALKHMPLR